MEPDIFVADGVERGTIAEGPSRVNRALPVAPDFRSSAYGKAATFDPQPGASVMRRG
jgi:hypothetical protein